MIWVEYNLWQVAEEAKESLKAAQFEKGKTGNAGGVPKAQADLKSGPPEEGRDIAQKHARSTVGKVAAAANVSHHYTALSGWR